MTTKLDEIHAATPEEVLRMDLAALRNLTPNDFDRDLTPAEIKHVFETCDALWLHDGDPARPHAELTSGKCSNGFVNVLGALRYTNLAQILAEQLFRVLCKTHHDKIDWVIGSDHAGATLSYAMAVLLGVQHDFSEKGEGKTQVWKRFEIQPDEVVLQVEELITTTGTLQDVRKGIREGTPHEVKFAPLVMTLVHRSDAYEFEGKPVVSLVHYDIAVWEPADCPLCTAGSKRLRPKANWPQLTGRAA